MTLKRKPMITTMTCFLLVVALGVSGYGRAETGLQVDGVGNSVILEGPKNSEPTNEETLVSEADTSEASRQDSAPPVQNIQTPVSPSTVITSKVQHTSLSDGILADLILNRVYQRDRELEKLTKRLGRVTLLLPFLTGAMLGGTALSQNIMALRLLDTVAPRLSERKAIPTLGIVGQSTLLGSLSGINFLRVHINRKIKARKARLQEQVNQLLHRLESGEDPSNIQDELSPLVGETFSREFMGLWKMLYLKP